MTNIQFKPVTGAMIMEEIENHTCETDVEYGLKNVYKIMTDKKLVIDKQGFSGTRSRTDGRMRYIIAPGHILEGIQEVKYKKPKTLNEMKKSLVQALHYNYFYYTQEFKEYSYFILPTEKGLAYVLRKDIEELINKLDCLFSKTVKSPSTNWSDINIRAVMQSTNIEFHYRDYDNEFKLNEIFAEIFNEVVN